MPYISQPGKILIIKCHCKHCHDSWIPRQEITERCPNQRGRDGKPKCGTQHWYEWPSSFNPNTTTCAICRVLWYEEQEEKERKASK